MLSLSTGALCEFCEDKNSQTRVGLVLASGNNVAVQGFERKVARVWQEHWPIKPYPALFPLKGLSLSVTFVPLL